MESRRFGKRPPRLERVFHTVHEPIYFVTFCTFQRLPWLANQDTYQAFVSFAEKAENQHGVAVGRYVILPDHLHLFVRGGADFVLGKWVRMLKICLGKTLSDSDFSRIQREMPPDQSGEAVQGKSRSLWQEGFFDHLLRNNESMAQKWHYIRENPVRAGLVSQAEDWPYAGEICCLDRV